MDARDKQCPVCGALTLDIELSLAPSVEPAQWVPVLLCRSAGCTFERPGHFEFGYAVFIVPEDA